MVFIKVAGLGGVGVGVLSRRDAQNNFVVGVLVEAARAGTDKTLWPLKVAPKVRKMEGLGSEQTVPEARVLGYVIVVSRADLMRGEVDYLSGQEDFYWYDDAAELPNILESEDPRARAAVRMHYDMVRIVDEFARTLRSGGSRVGLQRMRSSTALAIMRETWVRIKLALAGVTRIGYIQESRATRSGLIDELGQLRFQRIVSREVVETSTPLALNKLLGDCWWWKMTNWSTMGPIWGNLARGMVAAGPFWRGPMDQGGRRCWTEAEID